MFVFLLLALLAEMVFFVVLGPLLPRYAVEFHLGKLGAGILSASYAFGCGAAALPAGAVVGRLGSRVVVIGGLAVVGSACAAFAVARSAVMLDAARTIQGIGAAGLWSGAIAWLMEIGSEADRGRLIGLVFSAAGAGACLGPAVGALASVTGPRPVFLVLAAMIGAVAIFGVVVAGRRPAASRRTATPVRLRALLRSPRSSRALAVVALPSAGLGVIGVLVPLRLHALGASTVAIAVAYVFASILETIISPLIGRWHDRRGAAAIERALMLASIGCLICLAVHLSQPVLLVALALTVPVIGTLWVPGLADLTAGVEQTGADAGLALGMFNLTWAINQTVGAVGGAQLSKVGEAVPFLALIVLYAAGTRLTSAHAGVQRQSSAIGARKM